MGKSWNMIEVEKKTIFMLIRKNLFLKLCLVMFLALAFISIKQFFFSEEESKSYECTWNKTLDSLYTNYKCLSDPNCILEISDPADLFSDIPKEIINCLLDSMIKKEHYLWMDVYLYATIPDSIFGVSQKAIKRIINESHPCVREMWMLALAEHNIIDYKFENVCHIKKFTNAIPSAGELDFYWTHEYEYDISILLDSLKRYAQKNNIDSSYKIGTCSGKIINQTTDAFDVELKTTKSCVVNRILTPFNFQKKDDTLYLKIVPPTLSIHNDVEEIIKLPMYSFEMDKSMVTKMRENHVEQLKIERAFHHSFIKTGEKKYNPLKDIQKDEKIVLEIPCFDEDWAMNFYPFHVNKTKYPFISCEITSTKEKL